MPASGPTLLYLPALPPHSSNQDLQRKDGDGGDDGGAGACLQVSEESARGQVLEEGSSDRYGGAREWARTWWEGHWPVLPGMRRGTARRREGEEGGEAGPGKEGA